MRRGAFPWADVIDLAGEQVSIIFDVGANAGQTTISLRKAFPSAIIYSFEPVASTYRLLETNTGYVPRVYRFQHGLSDREYTIEIFIQRDSRWNSISKNIDADRGTTQIALKTIDQFSKANRIPQIHLIKTDTEGHDLAVLKGAKDLLSNHRIDFIYSEVGFYKNDLGHTNFCDLWTYLQIFGYQFLGLYEQDSIKFINHPVEPCYPWTNALFAKNELVEAKFGDSYRDWLAGLGLDQ
jgi:FkbM family methyltransferase